MGWGVVLCSPAKEGGRRGVAAWASDPIALLSCHSTRVGAAEARMLALSSFLAARRGAVRCGAVRCGAVRCGAVRCGAVRCGAVLCGAARCGAMRCDAVRCGAMRCGAMR